MKVCNDDTIKRVRKYDLDNVDEREKYEKILNNSIYHVTREEFAYDKIGRAVITVWYEEEV